MEDRHTVSEPRPVERTPNDGPSWEVDILRDDTVIVDTFLLNRDVLPPRINKKGKVLWKLPDTADKLVRLLCRIKLFIKTTSFFLRRNTQRNQPHEKRHQSESLQKQQQSAQQGKHELKQACENERIRECRCIDVAIMKLLF